MGGSNETVSKAPSLRELTRKYRRWPAMTGTVGRPVVGFGVRAGGSEMVTENSSLSSSWTAARTPSATPVSFCGGAWVSATCPVTLMVPVNGATQRRRLSTSPNACSAAACLVAASCGSDGGWIRPAVTGAAGGGGAPRGGGVGAVGGEGGGVGGGARVGVDAGVERRRAARSDRGGRAVAVHVGEIDAVIGLAPRRVIQPGHAEPVGAGIALGPRREGEAGGLLDSTEAGNRLRGRV